MFGRASMTFLFALTAGSVLQAGDILRGGATLSSSRQNAAARANVGQEAAARTKANAQDRMSRTAQAIQAVQAMQTAARGATASGQPLPAVPNGLGAGGLDLAGAPVGAQMPQQSGAKVTIRQTAQQAILNWKTFNVGKNTSLYFDQRAGGSEAGKWIAFNKVSDPSGSPSQILGSIKAEGQVYIINQNGIIFGAGSQVSAHALVASALPINDTLVASGLLNNPQSQFLFNAAVADSLNQAAATAQTLSQIVDPRSTLRLKYQKTDNSEATLVQGADYTVTVNANRSSSVTLTPAGLAKLDPSVAKANSLTSSYNTLSGDVIVQPGALLSTPVQAEGNGGRVMLAGTNVRNAGTISTPSGQTILAAGLQIGIDAHASNDPSLRGLDVFVGDVGSYAGTAANAGLIDAPRANVTMTGKTVEQLGVIYSTTSVSLNGRIDLLANYNGVSNPAFDATIPANGARFLFQNSGTVTLGPGSVTEILPEIWSMEAVAQTKLNLRSQINFQGMDIRFGQGAMVLAPSAAVTARAGVWKFTPSTSKPLSQFVFSGGNISLDDGAFIDVAGTTAVAVPLAQHILEVQLRGAELADAPLQRDAALRAVLLRIDIRKTGTFNGRFWVGTPLGDATGFLDLIERTVAQLTTAGGSVELQAGGSVVLRQGSLIDVSGGWIRHEGGMVKTTRLKIRGNIIDIEDATPDRLYDGIFTSEFTKTHAKWGIAKRYSHPLAPTGAHYEQSYLEGAAGGSIAISAPSVDLGGVLRGETVKGPRQVRSSQSSSALPKHSSLSLSFRAQNPNPPDYFVTYPAGLRVVFEAGAKQAALGGEGGTAVISTDLLSEEGFGSLTINNEDGTILVPADLTLTTAPGGTLSLTAANIDIFGKVFAPGGSLAFQALNISPYEAAVIGRSTTPVTPPPNAGRGIFTLGPEAVLSAAGLTVDDRPTSITPPNQPFQLHGGTVSITAYSAHLSEGSVIDASGGVAMTAHGKKFYGDGGAISIRTGQDPNVLSVLGGELKLGAELRGYSGTVGGSLTLQAPFIRIGGGAESDGQTLSLTPEFFNRGGFGSFTLIGLGAPAGTTDESVPAVLIAPGTVIEPVAQGAVGVPHAAGGKGLVLVPADKPAGLRTPVSLHFQAPGVRDSFTGSLVVRGDIVMGEDSLIRTDPLASVSFEGNTVAVLGSVYAPAGFISISGGNDSKTLFADQTAALTTVYIGPNSVLSAAGTTLYTPDPYGRRTGTVLPGGIISIAGNIVAAAGAILNVSGASAILDLPPTVADPLAELKVPMNSGLTSPLYNLRSVPTRVDSDAGTIILKGGQMLFSDATLLGRAGGPTALGGTLIVSSGRFYPEGATSLPTDSNLVVKQSGSVIPSALPAGADAIGKPVLGPGGAPMIGRGYFAVEKFEQGGFDALALNGVVEFTGPININARRALAVASGGVLYADSEVRLTAPYVALGLPFPDPIKPEDVTSPFMNGSTPFNFPPTHGPGRLIVNASLIDVGTLSLQNIGFAGLYADNGDIRGSGIFNIAGDLVLRAGQVYPVTASPFTIVAYDYALGGATFPGSVTVIGSGTRPLPLSAGGTLSIHASIINQGGVLRAPLGNINLGWDGTGTAPVDLITGTTLPFPVTQQLTLSSGSVTSVSAIDPITGLEALIPYGLVLNGTSWIDPRGVDITAGGVPGKTISLAAQNLNVQGGSLIDLSGGGDLYAYRWISGLGGNVDILGTPSGEWSSSKTYKVGDLVTYGGQTWSARTVIDPSEAEGDSLAPRIGRYWTQVPEAFAVLPGYTANFAPFAPFNSGSTSFQGDPGYANNHLKVGDRIFLGASSGLPSGVYTLLPARYALLPGAFLITPKSGAPRGTLALADGSSIVSGYRFNDLNTQRIVPALASRFEVAPAAVIRSRAQYEDYSANAFLRESALNLETAVPRLPIDAGHLILQATQSMTLQGDVNARGATGGRGGLVDIASTSDILIAGSGSAGGAGVLVLDASHLSGFGAESLLIGGVRTVGSTGTIVVVRTGSITVDNAGSPLSAPDIILVAKENLTLAPGAEIVASGSFPGKADTLFLGDAAVAGSGDGLLLRVSMSGSAEIVRAGISASTAPSMIIGAGALISGASLTLDSTYATALDPTARLLASVISLNSGQISLQLDNPGALLPTVGLVLSGQVLENLQAARSLSLLSYSSIDIYGAGVFEAAGRLALHAAEIRGFNTGGGTVAFNAGSITLDNSPGRASPGAMAPLEGTLEFNAGSIRLGAGQLNVDQYANLNLNAANGLFVSGSGGLAAQGALSATTPFIAAATQTTQAITAGGALAILAPAGDPVPPAASGLGASLTLQGQSVAVTSGIRLPSGLLTLHATGGDVFADGLLDVGGTAQNFYDTVKYTDGGQISLIADAGSVTLAADSIVSVAAHSTGGNAGTLAITTPNGSFTLDGTLRAQAGAGGQSGRFQLDVGNLPSLGTLNTILNDAAFTASRTFRVRNGDVLVDGLATSRIFNLSVDQGAIIVAGTIDASGATGGTINLLANGNVTLLPGSLLTVAGRNFSNAGQGGAVTLEAGTQRNGIAGTGSVDIQTGSTIDLSVASKVAGDANTPGSSAWFGQFSGKLHLRAPQDATSADLLVNPINGTIVDASSILVEGYRIFDLTNTSGTITNSGTIDADGGLIATGTNVQGSIRANGNLFGAGVAAMTSRLLANNAGLEPVLVLAPGAEIIHRTGNLVLGSGSSTTTSDWDLSTFRFGPKNAPGVLTLRAAGNLVFNNTLSDGFTPTLASSNASWLWTARLSTQNPLLPVNTQSWSYRLTAGADLSASDFRQVLPVSALGAGSGSLQLGKTGTNTTAPGNNAVTSSVIGGLYQVIRTGSGDIEINTGRSVQLLNQLATIYTAGTRVSNPTLNGTFDTPSLSQAGGEPVLGAVQQNYPAIYSMAGGNVVLQAQQNIEHLTRVAGQLVADSQFQMPDNWLYRRGFVDPATGKFGLGRFNDVESTTWWVDFSNFFQGVGALGGGDVTMIAGNTISNVDAAVPTNARMAGKDANGAIAPDAANLLELGGGDLTVRAGNNLDAGVYYVERGRGTLGAGGSIVTNATRSVLTQNNISAGQSSEYTQLPTTLFLGKGGFEVSARRDVLLGPVANPFLLPGGVNNSFWYKTYFSTYAPESFVHVSSLGGAVTLRQGATLPGETAGEATPLLQAWFTNKLVLSGLSASFSKPWLRLNETSVTPFGTIASLLPATLRATAFSGDINLAGDLTLSPAPRGTLELNAGGAINGLQPNGVVTLAAARTTTWGSSRINVSDANPASIPGIASPFAYQTVVGLQQNQAILTGGNFLLFVDNLFQESGSTLGAQAVFQTKQALHSPGLLHANDPDPLRLYARDGNISGLTLFSPKAAQIFSGRDINDVAFYVQNLDETDVTVVAGGRDIIPYNANTLLRVAASRPGNIVNTDSRPLAGDLQISGPGVLEILAGRNLDLGTGESNSDGTGVGITSIGNARNPYLSFAGADIVALAGIGPSFGLAESELDFETFISKFLTGSEAARYLAELEDVGSLDDLPEDRRNRLALQVFFLVLREAGRDFNREGSPGFGNYDNGFAAIKALFGSRQWKGDILTRSRDIRTKSGGDISLLAPGGKLTLATSTIGTPPAPPGIITESGGNISIFTDGNVDIGISRIFTLRGGDAIIWSSHGNIAAGSSSKTVKSAPPTRVLIDPQSADVTTDLAGLATGGGIGVLATVKGVPPGNVDLIAPNGAIDAGDAGIRATGVLNLAASEILNADNIQAPTTIGAPPAPPAPPAPNIAGLTSAASTAGASTSAMQEVSQQALNQAAQEEETPSLITVEVLGYGGGNGEG